MSNWKKFKPGDRIICEYHEFDGAGKIKGIISEVTADHALIKTNDGQTLWIDDDTESMFRKYNK